MMQTEEEKIGVLQKALSRSVNVAIEKLTAPSVLPLTLSKKVWNGYWEMQSAQDNLEKKITSDEDWRKIFINITGGRVYLEEEINIKEFMILFRSKLTKRIIKLLCDSDACKKLTYRQIGVLVLVLEPLSEEFDGTKENLGIVTKTAFCKKAKKVMAWLNENYSKILGNGDYDEDAFIMDLKNKKK